MRLEPYIALNDPKRFPMLKKELHKIQITLDFDTINDVLLPRSGAHLNFKAEDDLTQLKSETAFWKVEAASDLYRTYNRDTLSDYMVYWECAPTKLRFTNFSIAAGLSFLLVQITTSWSQQTWHRPD